MVEQRLPNWIILLSLSATLFALGMFVFVGVSGSGLERRTYLSGAEPYLTTFDRLPSFTKEAELLTDLWDSWDLKKSPLPKRIPNYRVDWTGEIDLPDPLPVSVSQGLTESVYRGGAVRGTPVMQSVGRLPKMDTKSRAALGEAAAVSIEWLGTILIEKAGSYTFFLSSDDGSTLRVDNVLVIDNAGAHREKEVSGEIFLTPGEHFIQLRYLDLGGAAALNWHWKVPDGERQPVPIEILKPTRSGSVVEALSTFPLTKVAIGASTLTNSNNLLHLKSGRTSINISLNGAGSNAKFELIRRADDGTYELVPRSAFRSTGGLRNAGISWLPVSLLLFSIFLLVLSFQRAESAFRFYAVVSLISVLGFSLRWFQYSQLPYLMDTIDEFMAPWSGLNFLLTGRPTSWVFAGVALETYTDTWLGRTFVLTPYAFHPPPLWPLITGVFSILGGARSMYEIQAGVFRIPALVSSALTIVPLMCFMRSRYGAASAVVAGLILATFPMFVLLGRLNKEETPLALLAMTVLFLLDRYLRSPSKSPPILLLGAIALGPLCKELGVFLGLFAGLSCIHHRRFQAGILCVAATVLGELLYVIPGLLLNSREFLQGVFFHSNLRDRVAFLHSFFSDLRVWQVAASSPVLWFWFAAASCRGSRNSIVWTALASFLLVYFFISPVPYDYPWYRICAFPFLSIFAGLTLLRFSRRVEFADVVLFFGLVLAASFQLLCTDSVGSALAARQAKLLTFLLVGAALLLAVLPLKLKQHAAIASIFFFILSNIYLVFSLERIYSGSLGGASNIL